MDGHTALWVGSALLHAFLHQNSEFTIQKRRSPEEIGCFAGGWQESGSESRAMDHRQTDIKPEEIGVAGTHKNVCIKPVSKQQLR